jgi:hypothetical protein
MDPAKAEQGDHAIDVDEKDWPLARSGMRV